MGDGRQGRWAKYCRWSLVALGVSVMSTPATATLDGCAKVLSTPDGFLALRAGPGLRFVRVGKLLAGDNLWVTDSTCQRMGSATVCDETRKWMHVSSVRRFDESKSDTTEGWVSRRYLQMQECE